MPQIGLPELFLILLIVLLIFGAGKLPEVFRAMGKGVREFRDAADGAGSKEDKNAEPRP